MSSAVRVVLKTALVVAVLAGCSGGTESADAPVLPPDLDDLAVQEDVLGPSVDAEDNVQVEGSAVQVAPSDEPADEQVSSTQQQDESATSQATTRITTLPEPTPTLVEPELTTLPEPTATFVDPGPGPGEPSEATGLPEPTTTFVEPTETVALPVVSTTLPKSTTTATATTFPGPQTAAPADFSPPSVTAVLTQSGVLVEWRPPADEVSGFAIYRDGSLLAWAGSQASSFVDASPVPGATHRYQVQTLAPVAGNVADSGLSASATVEIPVSTTSTSATSTSSPPSTSRTSTTDP